MLGQGDVDAPILDLRFNVEGEDNFSKAADGHFTEKSVLGYLKQTGKDGQFDSPESHKIEPSSQHHFLKQVVVLTNDKTVSEADVMTSIVTQLPTVTILGEPGNGSCSDIDLKELVNGWSVTFSNQRYFSPDGTNYEGRGHPVVVEMKNRLTNIEQQKDSVLLQAMHFLTNQN